jgi:Arginine-tRNA-protein transferase, C terminus
MKGELFHFLSRYAHLSLGKYSVLREVDFVRRASCTQPQLQYLYLGYYIPNNEKMMYKVQPPCCLYLAVARLCGCRVGVAMQCCRAGWSHDVVQVCH